MKFFLTSLCCLCISTLIAQHQSVDTLEYNVLMGGNPAGSYKNWQNPDGTYTERFQYNDRGRGDSTQVHYSINEKGFITWLEGAGVDYFKKPVFEKFSLKNGLAQWENNTEKDSLSIEGNASYEGLNISAGTSYAYYFNSPDTTVRLLPSGNSTLSLVAAHQLADGTKIELARLTGSDLTPSYVWLTEDHQLFAYASRWFAYLRNGYTDILEELLAIQEPISNSYFEDMYADIKNDKAQDLYIVNATYFDAEQKGQVEGATIHLHEGKIKEIATDSYPIPDGATILDASNKTVLPGLWDMHVHFGDMSQGFLHVANGVTNVRDMANDLQLLERREKIDSRLILGPRIQGISGFIDGAGEYAGPTGEIISSVEEGKQSIKKYADLGYGQIKLYSSIKPEWVAPLVKEAKQYGMRVSGHIPAYMLASEAIEAGYDEIQHTNMLFLNFYGKEIDTRTPLRFSTVANKAASFDFSSQEFKDFAALLKEKDIVLDPTISIFEGMFIGQAGKVSNAYAPIINRLPIGIQRYFKTGSSLEIPEGKEETFANSYANMLEMLRLLHEQGITLVPGTDAFAGFTLHSELENYVKAGIPINDVLRMATLTSAEVAGKAENYGSIKEGKVADLIIIDGNPLLDISDIRKVETVIMGTEILSTKDMLKAVSISYFK